MKLAYVMSDAQGHVDQNLAEIATSVLRAGLRVTGVVQINSDRDDCLKCDMDVRVLPAGPVYRISQSLGSGSKGCRLNPAELERAVADVERSLTETPELLIINKFGKHEADGRGFRNLIAEALSNDIPVLVGLNSMNKPAFDQFADGLATRLPGTPDAILTWIAAKCAAAA